MALFLILAGYLSGFWYLRGLIRTSLRWNNDPSLAKIVTIISGLSLCILAVAVSQSESMHDGFLALLAGVGGISLLLSALETYCPSRFTQIPTHQVLDEVVANMIAGFGFRQSWQNMCESLPTAEARRYQKILEHVVFSQQESNQIHDSNIRFVSELIRVDREPHRARQRIQEMRERFYLQYRFRRRSRQLTTQVRVQALILGVFYVGLVIVQILTREWTHFFGICLFLSMLLFGVGLYGLFWFSRRFKWNL